MTPTVVVEVRVLVTIDTEWMQRKGKTLTDVATDLEQGLDGGVRSKEGVLHVRTQTFKVGKRHEV